MPNSLSVVIPAYNEANAIRAGKLAQVLDWLAAQPYPTELIVVDDQSQDDTAALAAEKVGECGRVITIPHAGKAAAVIAGIRAAKHDWVLFSDMDQATPISEAALLLDALASGCDIAAGSRGVVRAGAPLGRYVLSWGQVILKTALLGLRITDTQCGFKAFTRACALKIIPKLVVYNPALLGSINGPSVTSGFDVEFLYVGQRLGYRICEIPVKWQYQQTRRVNLKRDALRGIRDLNRIVFARLRRQYPRRRKSPDLS